ncbi:MAG TPA: oxygenase MpaB family protein [Acidimicrobiales bacterium]|nr:oxygenase MpaB family protein [Acidimicrobiales bacterium]
MAVVAHPLGLLGPPPAMVDPQAMLGPDTVSARLLGHPAMLLGGPRALLLQLADPLVTAGVADHSDFHEAPFDRLLRTLSAMGTIAFADPETSARALRAVAATHERVRGRAPDGRSYAATDPHLAAWVHATLVDTALAVERRWLGLLSAADRARCYRETLRLAAAFGVPADALPPDLGGFERWFGERLATLEVSQTAREMADEILHPPLRQAWGPAGRAVELAGWPVLGAVTSDLLPPSLRAAYGVGEPARLPRSALAGVSVVARALAPLSTTRLCRPDAPIRLAAALTGAHV